IDPDMVADRDAGRNRRPHAHQNAITNGDPPGEHRALRQVNEGANRRVMVNRHTRVDDRVVADTGTWLDDAPGSNQHTSSDGCEWRHMGVRVNGALPLNDTVQERRNLLAGGPFADGDDGVPDSVLANDVRRHRT